MPIQDSVLYRNGTETTTVSADSDASTQESDSVASKKNHHQYHSYTFDFSLTPFTQKTTLANSFINYTVPFLKSKYVVEPFVMVTSLKAVIQSDRSIDIAQKHISGSDSTDTATQNQTSITKSDFRTLMRDDSFSKNQLLYVFQEIAPQCINEIDSSNTANDLKTSIIFEGQVLQPEKTYFNKNEYVQIESNNYMKINWQEKDWIFWPILMLYILFVWIRFNNNKFVNQIIIATLFPRASSRILREKNESSNVILNNLLSFFFFSSGVFLYQTLKFYNVDFYSIPDILILLTLCTIIASSYYTKLVSTQIIGFVFQKEKVAHEYLHNLKLFNISTGIFLLPIIVCIPFLNANIINESHLIYSGIFIYASFYFLRLLRGILISIQQNVSVFYILIYLCTLEILPLILLIKVILL